MNACAFCLCLFLSLSLVSLSKQNRLVSARMEIVEWDDMFKGWTTRRRTQSRYPSGHTPLSFLHGSVNHPSTALHPHYNCLWTLYVHIDEGKGTTKKAVQEARLVQLNCTSVFHFFPFLQIASVPTHALKDKKIYEMTNSFSWISPMPPCGSRRVLFFGYKERKDNPKKGVF